MDGLDRTSEDEQPANAHAATEDRGLHISTRQFLSLQTTAPLFSVLRPSVGESVNAANLPITLHM